VSGGESQPATTKPSILIVGNLLSSTLGVRSVSEDLADRLSNAGWNVLAASDKPGRLPRLLDMARTVWLRRRDYEAANVEVFSGPAFFWAEVVCLLLRLLGKPHILTLHGGSLPEFSRRWPNRVRRLLKSACIVTTPSGYLLEQMSVYRPDLTLLPNPLNLYAYDFRLRTQPEPRLVWLRAFHSIYNPSLAPRVLAHLVADFPDITLTMIGPDKGDGSSQAMVDLARRTMVAERILMAGKKLKPEISAWLNRGDVFLNTTNMDNMPVSVLEAMACGLCIVSTNVAGIPHLLEHEHDALLVPPDDSGAMAAAVRRILTSPQLAEKLSGNARKKAEQHDWRVILPQWESLFEEAINRD
jgi:glycosyltransferase involved in cell wall biosynthesis